MANSFKKFLKCNVKVELEDKRSFTGNLLAVDEFLNIVLNETVEQRKYKNKKGYEIRNLGLCIFRGSKVIGIKTVGDSEKNTKTGGIGHA
ncbi:U1 snRNP component [Trachipleistophora hominis]|uniref:Sm protein B n=1 Tax=Trachipleistophora hominis TaxID=72359 RepID=L7JXR0_TRAHO|nr:U1 snRNP component [Trachipleistophora hominis]